MILDAMSAPDDFPGKIRFRLDPPPDAEETGLRAKAVEHVQNLGCHRPDRARRRM